MRKGLFIALQFVSIAAAQAQSSGLGPLPVLTTAQLKNVRRTIDSLQPFLSHAGNDRAKINLLLLLSQAYGFPSFKHNWDSSFWYCQQALELSQKLNYEKGIFDARMQVAFLFQETGNYAKSLELNFTNLPIAEKYQDTMRLFFTIRQLSWIYKDINDFPRQLPYARKLQQLALSNYLKKQSNSENFLPMSLMQLAWAFKGLNQKDSALYYFERVYEIALSIKDNQWLAVANQNFADGLLKFGDITEALPHYLMTISYAIPANRSDLIAHAHLGLANISQRKNQVDSALYYAGLSLKEFQRLKDPAGELQSVSFLDELYAKENRMDSAHHYLALAVALKDSLFNQEKVKQVQTLQFAETLREQQIEQERKEADQRYANRLKIYSLIAGLVTALLIAYFLYRNNKQKQKANLLLQQKNEEIQDTLAELKSTQAQLIQSEKMASLGELTAGIAHEIQNPLNFVNNFSEVNEELISELFDEVDKGNTEEVKAIAGDIKQNLQKINHHGKRADAIVKGMLQHSRVSTGQKEPTDINALADEYLRLSYHGMRAKDKSFNAIVHTDFDESIGKINIVRQDIGRVLLNLFNNAFYAVNEKSKLSANGYEPTAKVITKKLSDKIVIKVADNGNGIPQSIVDKIFQPFFTTKPTGQGTGLGLSLSYDIIKAHGGEIRVETKEGEGSEFVIQLSV